MAAKSGETAHSKSAGSCLEWYSQNRTSFSSFLLLKVAKKASVLRRRKSRSKLESNPAASNEAARRESQEDDSNFEVEGDKTGEKFLY